MEETLTPDRRYQKEKLRRKIAKDVNRYIAAGGKIETIEIGRTNDEIRTALIFGGGVDGHISFTDAFKHHFKRRRDRSSKAYAPKGGW